MSAGKLVAERSGRDADRLARITRLIVSGKPAVAQALLQAEADAETERFAVRGAFTQEVGAA